MGDLVKGGTLLGGLVGLCMVFHGADPCVAIGLAIAGGILGAYLEVEFLEEEEGKTQHK
jgi:outer membrane lipoprotein SlyB